MMNNWVRLWYWHWNLMEDRNLFNHLNRHRNWFRNMNRNMSHNLHWHMLDDFYWNMLDDWEWLRYMDGHMHRNWNFLFNHMYTLGKAMPNRRMFPATVMSTIGAYPSQGNANKRGEQ